MLPVVSARKTTSGVAGIFGVRTLFVIVVELPAPGATGDVELQKDVARCG
jgi:hypothetical protein